ncbi:hypothetical protein NTE16_003699 [Vibrio mimicus]
MNISEVIKNHIVTCKPSLGEKSVEVLILLAQGHKQKDVAQELDMQLNNVSRISATYKELLDECKDIYKDYAIANNQKVIENDKSSVKSMIRKAKGLDYTYFNLLCSTVEDTSLSPSVRMSAYTNLQAFLSRVKDGDTQLNKDNPSVDLEADSVDLGEGYSSPKGLPSIQQLLAQRGGK